MSLENPEPGLASDPGRIIRPPARPNRRSGQHPAPFQAPLPQGLNHPITYEALAVGTLPSAQGRHCSLPNQSSPLSISGSGPQRHPAPRLTSLSSPASIPLPVHHDRPRPQAAISKRPRRISFGGVCHSPSTTVRFMTICSDGPMFRGRMMPRVLSTYGRLSCQTSNAR